METPILNMTSLPPYNLPIGIDNLKLLVRHAERPTLKGISDPDNVQLTQKGASDALSLGTSICNRLGVVYSSPITRCLQTASLIASTLPEIETQTSSILGYSFIDNYEDASKKFAQYNLKQVVHAILAQSKIKGFISKEDGIKNIIDLIFKTGGLQNTIDVYCTHDMHLSIIDGYMMNCYNSIAEITLAWPKMLEGMWFFGERADFYCSWRGIQKRFVNFLM
jgi:phosphohistidine phosphatase SixA